MTGSTRHKRAESACMQCDGRLPRYMCVVTCLLLIFAIPTRNLRDGIQEDPNVKDDRAKVYEGMNSDSEEDFEATYEVGDKDEDEDGDGGGEAVAKDVVVLPGTFHLSYDHSKLDSDTVAETTRSLVESDPSIKNPVVRNTYSIAEYHVSGGSSLRDIRFLLAWYNQNTRNN
ncbi:hypothetical protein AHAS_Ahas14G0104400 [Arachis hypogaea]